MDAAKAVTWPVVLALVLLALLLIGVEGAVLWASRRRVKAPAERQLCPYCAAGDYGDRHGQWVTCAGCRQRYRLGYAGGRMIGLKR